MKRATRASVVWLGLAASCAALLSGCHRFHVARPTAPPSEAVLDDVAAHRVSIGMEPYYVVKAWGKPCRTHTVTTAEAVTDVWKFCKGRNRLVTFVNGFVAEIRE